MTDLDLGQRDADDVIRDLKAYLRASGEAAAPPMSPDLLADIVLSEIRRGGRSES
jgi:hypothetical protein